MNNIHKESPDPDYDLMETREHRWVLDWSTDYLEVFEETLNEKIKKYEEYFQYEHEEPT